MRPPADVPLRRPGGSFFGWLAVFLLIGLLVALLNRYHVEQQSNYTIYVAMANYYRGLGSIDLLTYPTWGYPFALILVRRYELVTIFQVALAAAAMAALFLRLRGELPGERRPLTILFVAALPWYLLHSVKWPLSFAASFGVFGILVLERAVGRRSVLLGGAAGALFGIGLYFRSEYLYLPVFIIVVGLIGRVTRRLPRMPLPPLVASAVAAWMLLVPWGLHYRQQTGHFSLTASQRGIVAFISLGQLPGNPWGAVYEDEYAYAYLDQVAPHLRVNSDSADRLLVDEFKRRVRAEPLAFAAKMVWNAGISLVSGFYGGEVPLSPSQWDQFREIKQRPWAAVLPVRRGDADVDARTRLTLIYWLAAKSVGSLLVVLAMAGLIVTLWRGTQSPLLVLCAATILYQWLLFIVLSTEPRYKNGLYLCMIPFVVAAWRAVSLRLSSVRLRPTR